MRKRLTKPAELVSFPSAYPPSMPILILVHEGVNLSPEEISAKVKEYFDSQTVEGWSGLMTFINGAKATPGLRWASPIEVKTSAEKVFTEKFGAKETAASSKSKAKVCSSKALRLPDD